MKNRDEGMVKTYHRKKLLVSITCVILALLLISIRLLYVCVFQSSYYLEKAQKLHERERDIKALRGEILDRNGVVVALDGMLQAGCSYGKFYGFLGLVSQQTCGY